MFYARKRAEKMTPKNETPEITRTVPSLVVDDVGVEADPVPVAVLDLVTIDVALEAELDFVTVGRPAKRTELVSVWQLDEEGIRAV